MITVFGSTGNSGREAVRVLAERAVPFQAFARDATSARERLGAGVDVVVGDLADEQAVARALDDVDSAYLVSTNAPEQVELQGNVIRAAQLAGLAHVVKVSGLAPETDRSNTLGRWHLLTENELRHSGLGFTILRPSLMIQNLLMHSVEIAAASTISTPIGPDAPIAFVDARDVGAVGARMLVDDSLGGGVHIITGGVTTTLGEIADLVGATLGRTVRYVQITAEAFCAGMIGGGGVPEWLATYVAALYDDCNDGLASPINPQMEALLGCPPRAIADFVGEAVHALVR